MAFKVDFKIEGGQKLRRLLRDAQRGRSVPGVEIGFLGSDRGARGALPADLQAKLIEFGTEETQANPFIAPAIPDMQEAVLRVVKADLRARLRKGMAPIVTRKTAREAGEAAAEVLRESMERRNIRDSGTLLKRVRVRLMRALRG